MDFSPSEHTQTLSLVSRRRGRGSSRGPCVVHVETRHFCPVSGCLKLFRGGLVPSGEVPLLSGRAGLSLRVHPAETVVELAGGPHEGKRSLPHMHSCHRDRATSSPEAYCAPTGRTLHPTAVARSRSGATRYRKRMLLAS